VSLAPPTQIYYWYHLRLALHVTISIVLCTRHATTLF
jgi:hypothetical protein